MKNIKKFGIFTFIFGMLLTSCGQITDISLKSPNEDGGLEGNQDQDTVEKRGTEELKKFLTEVGKNEFYSYDLTLTISGETSHFINYYTPNAFYELNDVFENSIGYAQDQNEEIFNFRMSEDLQTVYPSLYVYGDVGSFVKMTTLYDALTSITNFTFLSYSMDEFSAEHISGNKFLITDSITSSIFQFMTSYGASIQSLVTGVYVEIINYDNLSFKCTVELGSLGNIVGIYTKDDCEFLLGVNRKASQGLLVGYDYHQDVKDFFELSSKNNYKIEGIFEKLSVGEQTKYPQNYYCTEDYFYIEYLDEYAKDYKSWGMVLVEANTPVTYYDVVDGVKVGSHTQTLPYDSCYRFSKYNDEFVIDFFKGPTENNGLSYLKVDKLPLVGKENTLYIVYNKETGENEVYIYTADAEGNYGFSYYSTWFDSVGDFFIKDYATFYLGSTYTGAIGPYYFEQSINDKNSYFCNNKTINSDLANSIFAWGWNPTNTWMDYILSTTLDLRKDSNGSIYEADLGVNIQLSNEVKKMYYTLKDFGTTSVSEVEEFLKGAF